MNSQSSSAASSISSLGSHDTKNPLWRYVTRFKAMGGGGGGVSWKSKFCGVEHRTTYTRVKNHLLKLGKRIAACTKVTPEDIVKMKMLLNEEVRVQSARAPRSVPMSMPPQSISTQLYSSGPSFETKKRKEIGGSSSSFAKAFGIQGRSHLDAWIARFFYTPGLPFHLARSPYYASSYSYVATNNLAGYVPLGYNALRTTLLQQIKENVERLLQPIKKTWREK